MTGRKEQLKALFETGKIPFGEHFAEFIEDSYNNYKIVDMFDPKQKPSEFEQGVSVLVFNFDPIENPDWDNLFGGDVAPGDVMVRTLRYDGAGVVIQEFDTNRNGRYYPNKSRIGLIDDTWGEMKDHPEVISVNHQKPDVNGNITVDSGPQGPPGPPGPTVDLSDDYMLGDSDVAASTKATDELYSDMNANFVQLLEDFLEHQDTKGSPTEYGHVKVDGITITSSDGVISATGGGSGTPGPQGPIGPQGPPGEDAHLIGTFMTEEEVFATTMRDTGEYIVSQPIGNQLPSTEQYYVKVTMIDTGMPGYLGKVYQAIELTSPAKYYVRFDTLLDETPYLYEDDWKQVGGGSGTPGPKGDKGDPGEQGIQGLPGAEGAVGPKGDKGDKGETGSQGNPGTNGLDGAKGDKGDTGATGPKGDKGDKGDTGATGPQGIPGEDGDPLQIANNLTTTVAGKALDATQGKKLSDDLSEHAGKVASTTELGHVKIDGTSVKMNANDQMYVDLGDLPIPIQINNEYILSDSPTTYPVGHTITMLGPDDTGFADLISEFNLDYDIELTSLNTRFIVQTVKNKNSMTHQTAQAITNNRGSVLGTMYRFSQSSYYGFSSWYSQTHVLTGRGAPGDQGRGEGISGNLYVNSITGKVHAKAGYDKTVGYTNWRLVGPAVVNNTFDPVEDDDEHVYSAYAVDQMFEGAKNNLKNDVKMNRIWDSRPITASATTWTVDFSDEEELTDLNNYWFEVYDDGVLVFGNPITHTINNDNKTVTFTPQTPMSRPFTITCIGRGMEFPQ